ncbi:MAG: hypothetical protein GC131_08205 [Alphaproteobacteria bacterium]|nr:hypothetical protein [Alphaproteobacteria bacterium]
MVFDDLVSKFGQAMAVDILYTVEKMACVQVTPEVQALGEAERLKRAYAALDALDAERKEAHERAEQEQTLSARRNKKLA